MTQPDDILVIGGGIQGAAVALLAAERGYRVRLIEQAQALATATSSRSSKLVHGGLRYLEQAAFGLVRESLHDRSYLLRHAPDLVRLVPFHIPVYRNSRRKPATIRFGLALYALLGGLGTETRFARLPRADWASLDGLDTGDLRAVFRYYDAQTDDRALTRAVMYRACALGATLHLNEEVTRIELRGDAATVETDKGTYAARCVVNAAGAWINRLLARVAPEQPPCALSLVQGTHIVVPGTLARGVYYLEAPTDGRAVFVMPWKGQVMIGTTETDYAGDPAEVRPLPEEIRYLQQTTAHYFHGGSLALEDVREAFAGLRVLPASGDTAFARSRDTQLFADRPRQPRLITICGGKLTVHRSTARKVLHLLAASLPQPPHSQATDPRLTPAPDDWAGG